VAGAAAGGVGAVPGAAAGASLGGTVGGLVGGAVQKGQAPETKHIMFNDVPTIELSQNAQHLSAGARALNRYPDLAQKYAPQITQAYIQSQMQLKRRS
jgi:hypothetical protein